MKTINRSIVHGDDGKDHQKKVWGRQWAWKRAVPPKPKVRRTEPELAPLADGDAHPPPSARCEDPQPMSNNLQVCF